MRVLVTGACGFFGSNLITHLLKEEDVETVFGVDNFSRGAVAVGAIPEKDLGKKLHLIHENYQELTVKQINNMAVDIVYHFAGYSSAEESMQTPEEYFWNNEYGILKLLETLLRTRNHPYLVLASSVEAAGADRALSLTANEQPLSVLTATRIAAESYGRTYFDWHHYPVIIVRNPNTYGEFQNVHGYAGVVSVFIQRALKEEPLIVYNNGQQTRDFLYVGDAVKAYGDLRAYKERLMGQMVALDKAEKISINEMAVLVKELTDSASEIIYLPGRSGLIPNQSPNVCNLSDIVPWQPQVSLREGLARTIAWQKKVVQKYA